METLATSSNDVCFLLTHYEVPDKLKEKMELLLEVRHEIIHPAHLPSGEKHNTPAYLEKLRAEGILQSTGKQSDYVFVAQMQSHKLFRWAFETIREVVELILASHRGDKSVLQPMLESYSRYKEFEKRL